LALDTSTEWASVALYDGRDVLAEETWHAQRRHADELFPTIERLLARTRITLASIDKIAVATGPGSFTGLRIGIAAAQGMARGAGAASSTPRSIRSGTASGSADRRSSPRR